MANVVILGLPQAMAKIAAIPVVAEVSGEAGLTAGKLVVAADARARPLLPQLPRYPRCVGYWIPVDAGMT